MRLGPRLLPLSNAGLLFVALAMSCLVFLLPNHALAAVTLVQTKTNFGTATSSAVSFAPAATAGRLLIVVCATKGSSVITGPSGYNSIINQSGTMSQAIFYKIAVGGETNVTCNFSSSLLGGIHIYEYSGLHTYSSYETSNSVPSFGTGVTANSGTISTTHANDLIFAAVSNDSGLSTTSWNNSFIDQTISGNGFGQNKGGGSTRIYFDAAAYNSVTAGNYSGAASFGSTTNWRGQIIAFRAMSNSPSLSVDIVDGSGNPVASPSTTTTSFSKGFTCQTPTGTLGTATQKIRINNTTDNPSWVLAIAATSGPTARWLSGSNSYDFNDPAGSTAGCTNGQLSFNPSVSTITPQSNCPATSLVKGAESGFVQGTNNSISLITASSPAYIDCYWDITGVGLSQKVPANQPSGNYSLNLTLTITAN